MIKKRLKIFCVLLALCLLFTTTLTGCSGPSTRLQRSMKDYTQMLEGDLPEDLRLTIYYASLDFVTRAPVRVEDLILIPITRKIVVESEELAKHKELLKKMDASILQPVQEETYIDARLYYVFEVGESEKLLEVVVSPSQLYKINGSVVVNGIEVEDNPIFYELIAPFLTEDAHNKLGI